MLGRRVYSFSRSGGLVKQPILRWFAGNLARRLHSSGKVKSRYNDSDKKEEKEKEKERYIPRGRKWAIFAGGSVVLGAAAYELDEQYGNVGLRSVRALYVLLWVALQYKNSSSYDSIHDLHDVAAEKLLNMIETNKGLFIKIGQAIANQGTLFPIEYQRRFNRLYDNAPVDDWRDVDRVLKQNLGEGYELEMFEHIDHVPMASASIAQVHKAVLKDTGAEVALKVQHYYIQHQMDVDLLVYRFMTKVYEKVFDIPMSFFSKYIAEQIAKETDFVNEKRNSDRLESFLNMDMDRSVPVPETHPQTVLMVPNLLLGLILKLIHMLLHLPSLLFTPLLVLDVRVPHIYSATKQVIISEFIDGVSLLDKEELIQQGYDLSLIMNQYLSTLGKQIFQYGFVHSDPHPGNLIARFTKLGKQELILLDHGLYIELSDTFREQYQRLFVNVFQFDRKGIKEIANNWGIKGVEVFATLVQLKPVKNTNEIGERRCTPIASRFPRR